MCSLLERDEQFLWALLEPEKTQEEREEGGERSVPSNADSEDVESEKTDNKHKFIYEAGGEGKGFHLESMQCGETDFTKAENRHLLTRVAAELTQ